MNKTDKASIAESFEKYANLAQHLSNAVYNTAQRDEKHKDLGQTVREFDAARNHFRETLQKHGVISSETEQRQKLKERNK